MLVSIHLAFLIIILGTKPWCDRFLIYGQQVKHQIFTSSNQFTLDLYYAAQSCVCPLWWACFAWELTIYVFFLCFQLAIRWRLNHQQYSLLGLLAVPFYLPVSLWGLMQLLLELWFYSGWGRMERRSQTVLEGISVLLFSLALSLRLTVNKLTDLWLQPELAFDILSDQYPVYGTICLD